MKLGLIGYGKMGKDIFSLFFDKLDDAEFVVLDLADAEKNTAAVEKTLSKSLRRKKITEEQFEKKRSSFVFTDDVSQLSGCDVVIEAIFEDLQAKKDMFSKAANAVSSDCLLLTNTSSLSIAEIFDGIPNAERCFGMHFFYPVKLTGFVEMNVLSQTSADCIEKAKSLVLAAGKKPIVFSGAYHIYLNQILACMVAHAIYLREDYGVSTAQLSRQWEELFPVAGPFDVLDSVGLGLMATSPDNFKIERNKGLSGYGCKAMNKWIDDGCPKGTLEFLDFISERESDSGNSCDDAELYMSSLILNETVNALEESGADADVLLEAIHDTLGIAQEPAYYYKKYTAETVFEALDKLYEKTGFGSYIHKDKSVWDKYFS